MPAPGPQKFPIASAHQRDAALHQAVRSIAQIVRLPSAIGDALLAEQRFGNDAIAATSSMRVERTDRSAQAFAPLFR